MSHRRKFWQFIVLGIVVSLLLSIYADIGELVEALGAFEWALLPVVIALTLGNQFLRFVKWEYLLGKMDVDLSVTTSFLIFGSGLIMIMTPGKLGELWKSWLVRDVNGTPLSRTMPVIATERITDLLGVTSISLLGAIAFDESYLLLAVLALPLLGGIVLLQHERTCHWLLDTVELVPVLNRRADSLRDLYTNSREVLRFRPLVVTTALSICSWGLECVGLWLVLLGFDVHVPLVAAAFVFALSSIFGALSLLPGGLGVTEGSMTALLLLFGVSRVAAASSTLVIRAATLWFVAGLALFVYLVFRRQHAGDLPDLRAESDTP